MKSNNTTTAPAGKVHHAASTLTALLQNEVIPQTTATRLTVRPFTFARFPIPIRSTTVARATTKPAPAI